MDVRKKAFMKNKKCKVGTLFCLFSTLLTGCGGGCCCASGILSALSPVALIAGIVMFIFFIIRSIGKHNKAKKEEEKRELEARTVESNNGMHDMHHFDS